MKKALIGAAGSAFVLMAAFIVTVAATVVQIVQHEGSDLFEDDDEDEYVPVVLRTVTVRRFL